MSNNTATTAQLKALLPFTTSMSPNLQQMAEAALLELSRRGVTVTRFDFKENA
jgi:hypothetical protein